MLEFVRGSRGEGGDQKETAYMELRKDMDPVGNFRWT